MGCFACPFVPLVPPIARSIRLKRARGGRRLKKIPGSESVNRKEAEEAAAVSERLMLATFRLAATDATPLPITSGTFDPSYWGWCSGYGGLL